MSEDKPENHRTDVYILGRKIGTASGWDAFGEYAEFQYYDFVPDKTFPIIQEEIDTLYIDYLDGILKTYDKDGNVTNKYNIDFNIRNK